MTRREDIRKALQQVADEIDGLLDMWDDNDALQTANTMLQERVWELEAFLDALEIPEPEDTPPWATQQITDFVRSLRIL